MNESAKKYLIYAFFLLVSILPFLPYIDKHVVQTMTELSFHPDWIVKMLSHTWTQSVFSGIQTISSMWFLPIAFIFSIGPSPQLTFFFFSVLHIFTAIAGSYLLFNAIFSQKDYPLFAAPALLYGFSLYVISGIGGSLGVISWYCFFPLYMWLFLKYGEKKNPLVFLALCLLPALLAGTNLSITIIYESFSLIFLLFLAWHQKLGAASHLRTFALTNFIALLLCAFWILPQYFLFSDTPIVDQVLGSELFYNSRTTVLSILSFTPDWSFFGGFKDHKYNFFSDYYRLPLVIGATFAILVLAASALLHKQARATPIFAALVFCFAVAMVVGFNPNFISSYIFKFFFDSFSLFRIFRNTGKFMGVACFSMALLLACLLQQKSKRQGHAVAVLLVLLGGIVAFPMLNGKIFNPVIVVKELPAYWAEFGNYSQAFGENDRILSLPEQYFPVYMWDGHRYAFPSSLLNAVSPAAFYSSSPVKGVRTRDFNAYLFGNYLNHDIRKIAQFAGYSHVLVRKDSDWQFYDSEPPEKTMAYFSSFQMQPYASFGNALFLYKLGQFNMIYSADKAVEYSSMHDLFSKMEREQDKSAFFAQNGTALPFTPQQCTLDYIEKRSPAETHIGVSGSNCALVYLQSFDANWRAYVSQKKPANMLEIITSAPISEENHIMANGFANAWLIQKECKNSCNVALFYYPEFYYQLGLHVSLATLLSLIAYALWKSKGYPVSIPAARTKQAAGGCGKVAQTDKPPP